MCLVRKHFMLLSIQLKISYTQCLVKASLSTPSSSSIIAMYDWNFVYLEDVVYFFTPNHLVLLIAGLNPLPHPPPVLSRLSHIVIDAG